MKDSPAVADAAALLIARVAARVREARRSKGMPRRELSELSGVSPRYLAQLEAGEGNISIALLQRIATALDLRIEALMSESAAWDSDLQRVVTLYRQAPATVQDEVRRVLAVQNPAALRASRICLTGLRGAGKSTLGKLAGETLGLPFVELNSEIETQTAMPLSEVMALYGEDGYRALEAEALARVIERHDRMILAVAGGIVAGEQTYARLIERFHTIWIRTSPAEHMQRVRAQGDLRPMQGNPAAMQQLRGLLEARAPAYEKASAQVNTSNRTVSSSLNDLLAVIASKRFLEVPGA
ncbi:helix-turn-helix transcriptional regulator [Roseobacter ponti]|uniref:Shikimate kinase n=1 Tax=Roseobacter ponti TaxID=1891787 RepID=A0A858SVB8_9RHOB|nr:helix-turn-helix transcriptional regulator [Roseobacter ponti]QJF52674.1 helix-turn-helix transcriptional regulator [Roseobacter ponti]